MCHFLIVNTTQKSVDKAVEQCIFARLHEITETEDVPHLPWWIQKIVETGDDEQALKLVDYLNKAEDSPWRGKVEMANQESKRATINQKSFVRAVKKYVLTANNPVSARSLDQQQRIFLNYWKAIAALLDNEGNTVLFKYNGVDLFCRFSIPVFSKLSNIGDFKTATIQSLLKSTFENIDGEYAAVGHPDWWASGSGPAGGLNASALAKVNQDLTRALHKGADIQL
jgi:hypothetical protein